MKGFDSYDFWPYNVPPLSPVGISPSEGPNS
jgi:hypothetical protein